MHVQFDIFDTFGDPIYHWLGKFLVYSNGYWNICTDTERQDSTVTGRKIFFDTHEEMKNLIIDAFLAFPQEYKDCSVKIAVNPKSDWIAFIIFVDYFGSKCAFFSTFQEHSMIDLEPPILEKLMEYIHQEDWDTLLVMRVMDC